MAELLKPSISFFALASTLLLSACGGGGGGGGTGGGGGDDTVGPLATRTDALRAASVALGVYEAFDPNANDLLPFADPLFAAKRARTAHATVVRSKAAEQSDCFISGKRFDEELGNVRRFGLFDDIAVDNAYTVTTFFACKDTFDADSGSVGVATFDGALETGGGRDDEESDDYTYFLLGKSGDATQNYHVVFEQQDDNEQVVETDTYDAAGLIENGSFTDRIESRISRLVLRYTQKIGSAAATTFQATLAPDSAPLKLVRRDDGGQTIDGRIVFSSPNPSCVGGSIDVSTPTPLKGDASITEGVLMLASGNSTARLAFTASGDVDVTLGNRAAERVTAAEFQALLDNNGC